MVCVIRRMRGDETGVASTVGTIMALLVFLTFLSLIVNQYVPVWMKDSEAAHMSSALGQFGGLKGSIDLQILAAQMAQGAGTTYLPITSSSPITLGIDGVPIFSGPTLGSLVSLPDSGAWNVSFAYRINGVLVHVWQNASGAIDLNVANRYFPGGHIVYENGAVIRAQADGQVVRAEPAFQATRSGSNVTVAFQLINLYGHGGVTGTTTEVVNAKVFGVNRQDYTDLASRIWINHTSAYGLAWYGFMNRTLATGFGVTGGTFFRDPQTVRFTTTYYKIEALYNPVTGLYVLRLEVYDTPTPIAVFTLQTAHVQIGIGEGTNVNV